MIIRIFLVFYRLAWIGLLPLVLIYLWRRGQRDREYRQHLAERFGFYRHRGSQGAIWLHAVSLGETRSATGLIRAMLARGDQVLLTHFTPAGRRESARLFAPEIATGQLQVVWVPLDMAWCYRRFFKAFRPRIGLALEAEIWPAMVFAARSAGIGLYLCNAQYATRSFERDCRGLRLRLRVAQGLAGALVKSAIHAQRFTAIGLRDVAVTGELRFDQPVPANLLQAARTFRAQIAPARGVVTIASGVEGEERLFLELILRQRDAARTSKRPPPLFIYVPRAPERFDAVAEALETAGIKVVRRSEVLDKTLQAQGDFGETEVLLGDSLGEMFFYLALADRVVVGGGFTPKGAHNVIEPLMLGKPVLVGPIVWTIEYPFVEAELAGIACSVPDPAALFAALSAPQQVPQEQIEAFLMDHAGASGRTLAEIDRILTSRARDAAKI
ncbi:3-deoxy-D-manno-octulosonic acid transferase [Rhodobacter maris]|uniref:3-deoxy-D-manno-octulosonic acid transferase n=1 Tax=Rhodobacter maris TaxID=446682 RepID=A0A285RZH4_9RHOB|nr:glycosyltransferase N-terminal domain-containing protein [Rhodobacter maris]SOB99990.1 3-deoxy-D-manno-octulosonic-acid transferase [Rhodobacter maris]